MGSHINERGEFQSDKHPDLPPDRIRLNFNSPGSQVALWVLAQCYAGLFPETGCAVDHELAEDIGVRLFDLGFRPRGPASLFPGTHRQEVRRLLRLDPPASSSRVSSWFALDARLAHLRSLQAGWDGHDSPPVSRAAIDAAREVARGLLDLGGWPSILPVPTGGVLIEHGSSHVEIDEAGAIRSSG